ncbi:MAG: beta-glucosidase [Actinobacteria bacterium]|nr:beta-glucosidase [Actinomycetota bacterium]
MPRIQFPDGFVWGAATASYQIEGAVHADGRGASIWDTFSHTPGTVLNGDTGDVACDHYHRLDADLDLMVDLGLRAYRFSIAWPRVVPDGTGQVNQAGLDFYDRLVDGLLERGITPFATLYHWDLPQALQDRGGWEHRDIVPAFTEYTQAVVGRLGDRVVRWITHNEPWVVSFLGNYEGVHAPGQTDLGAALSVAHHLLVSHGAAVPVIRSGSPGGEVGITVNLGLGRARTDAPADMEAVRALDGYANRWFLDPLYGKGYPSDMVERFGAAMPAVNDADLDLIATPTDFLGINSYNPSVVRPTAKADNPLGFDPLTADELTAAGYELTAMGWPIVPEAFGQLITRVARDYEVPAIYITENGAAFDDEVVDGRIDDPRRTDFLRRHLAALRVAIDEGAPVRGYFAWSLMDNFEWALGYARRFGLVHVDYETLERTPKASAHWYHDTMADNGFDL